MTAPTNFKKGDVKRALGAVAAAGLKVVAIRFLPEGGFAIDTDETEKRTKGNPWEEVISDEA